jgi:hypothetical protein
MLWEVDVHLRQNDPAAQELVDAANDLGLSIPYRSYRDRLAH